MPERVEAWMRDEVTEKVWNILDVLKSIDEEMVKDWVRQNWPDGKEVYEE
uniref:Uncharacterized protein n=1 Tax=viral metagenome TaxID=1070528 RepID=A0A6H1ZPJ5_9ZZZZ